MAPSNSILWIGTSLLLLLLGFSAGISEGAFPRQTENDVFLEKTAYGETARINLPLIVDMAIEFRFALNWKKVYTLCGKKENELLNNCGLSDLMKSIQVRQREQHPKQDMEKALNTLCSAYDQFTSCVEEQRLLNCKSDDRVIIDLLLPYLCGTGKPTLLKSYTGTCLSTVSAASIDDLITQQTDCESGVSQWDSVFSMLLAQMRNYLSFDEAAVKEHLQDLCSRWNNLEKCIFPAYAKKCGGLVQTFYTDLLNHIKVELAKGLATYGKEVKQLAACKQVRSQVLPETTTTTTDPPMASPFMEFIKGQMENWTLSSDRSVRAHGTCHVLSSYYRMMSCFWKSAYDSGPKLEAIIQSSETPNKELCPLFTTFSTCYDNVMSSCPPDIKVNYRNFTEQLCKVMENELNYNAMRTVLQHCGYTLSQFSVYFWYRFTSIYMETIITCSDTLTSLGVDFECFYKEPNAISHLEAVKQAQSFIRLTEKVITDYTAYVKKLRLFFCL